MIGSPWEAALYGALVGALAGWLSRRALKRFLNASDKVFYLAFGAGMLARFLLLLLCIWFLRHEKYIIISSFAFAMILVQMLFEAFPLKHGTKTNP